MAASEWIFNLTTCKGVFPSNKRNAKITTGTFFYSTAIRISCWHAVIWRQWTLPVTTTMTLYMIIKINDVSHVHELSYSHYVDNGGDTYSYSRIYMRGISFSGKNTSKIEHTVDFVWCRINFKAYLEKVSQKLDYWILLYLSQKQSPGVAAD